MSAPRGEPRALRWLPAFVAGALACLAGAGAAQDALEVVASREGFRPKTLKLRKGETVRILLKTADEEHCFAVDALRVEKRILPGRATPLDLTPDQAGSFPYYCCLESGRAAEVQRGQLVVTE